MDSAPLSAAGQEVLVVDADPQVVKGLERLFTKVGLIVTGTADPLRARDQILNKFFAVAIIDFDTPGAGEGLELLQFAQDKSPLTSVIIMSTEKSFETAVKAFRGGAVDVVLKDPAVVPYLRERVLEAATELRANSERNTLLEEVAETHEDFLRRMRDLAKQCQDLEDRILGRTDAEGSAAADEPAQVMSIVLVDDDPDAVSRLEKVLTEKNGWRLRSAMTGGEALDVVTQSRPHVVIVKELLPDLPGSMVVKTVKGSAPDAVTLLYNPPARRGAVGEVKMVESSRVMTLMRDYSEPEQLLGPLNEIREALRQKMKERRYLLAFRQRNFEFLQRYHSLRQRIASVLERGRK